MPPAPLKNVFPASALPVSSLLKRILAGYAAGVQGFGGTGVKVSGDIEDLLLSQHQRRHTFIGTAETNDFADLVHPSRHEPPAASVRGSGARAPVASRPWQIRRIAGRFCVRAQRRVGESETEAKHGDAPQKAAKEQ